VLCSLAFRSSVLNNVRLPSKGKEDSTGCRAVARAEGGARPEGWGERSQRARAFRASGHDGVVYDARACGTRRAGTGPVRSGQKHFLLGGSHDA
jgi:hypothetical protein